jgi:hypothetical protein
LNRLQIALAIYHYRLEHLNATKLEELIFEKSEVR